MANSARARAHTPGINSDNQEHHTPNVSALPPRPALTASSWARQAADDVDNLQGVLDAYVGLEKLLAPVMVKDSEEVTPRRSELSALVRMVNEVLAQRLQAAEDTIGFLRESLASQGRAA